MQVLLKDLLRPHTLAEGDHLVRLGRAMDGGYVLPESVRAKTEWLLSYGIGNEYSFETQMSDDGAVVTMNDHTISAPSLRGNMFFIKEACTPDALKFDFKDEEKNTILKLDIEGDEYECLYSCDKWEYPPACLIVEFHWLNLNEEKLCCVLGNLSELGYRIVHLHGNNHAALLEDGLPDTIEVTFVDSAKIPVGEPFVGTLPLPGIDFPNNPDAPDYVIEYPQ